MRIFILAGGFATRLWPITAHRAKPLLLVDGQPILSHQAAKISAEIPIVILTNDRFYNDVAACVRAWKRPNVTVWNENTRRDGEKLGALKALALALQEFPSESIQVWAGDNLLPQLEPTKLNPTAEHPVCLSSRMVASAEEARAFGVLKTDADGSVQQFWEKPAQPASLEVCTGFFGMNASAARFLQAAADETPDGLGNIFPYWLAKKIRIKAIKTPGPWFDVGSFSAYLSAHQALQKSALHNKSPKTTSNINCHGKVFIGEHCQIENCQLSNCLIYDHCQLKNCSISHSVIDQHSHLEGVTLNQKLIHREMELIAESE